MSYKNLIFFLPSLLKQNTVFLTFGVSFTFFKGIIFYNNSLCFIFTLPLFSPYLYFPLSYLQYILLFSLYSLLNSEILYLEFFFFFCLWRTKRQLEKSDYFSKVLTHSSDFFLLLTCFYYNFYQQCWFPIWNKIEP